MNENLTEVVFVLDRSGSMFSMATDTIGGFNAMLAEQKNGEGKVLVSTVLFNDYIKVLHDRVDIEKITPLTAKDYSVYGCTALLDAVGSAIHHIGNVHKYAREEDRPSKTLFVITTDGLENASRHYTYERIKQMIERQKGKYGWEFIFLGANIDAENIAESMGIDRSRAARYANDSEGVQTNFAVIERSMRKMRAPCRCKKLKEFLDEDDILQDVRACYMRSINK